MSDGEGMRVARPTAWGTWLLTLGGGLQRVRVRVRVSGEGEGEG